MVRFGGRMIAATGALGVGGLALLAFALLALVGEGSIAPAEAAVRSCKAAQSSGVVLGPTENEGKRRAILGWMEKAKPFGPRYMGWGTAANRILKCVRGKTGQFECIAVAMPCTVEQNPNAPGTPQPGKPPGPRKRPGDPGRPIET